MPEPITLMNNPKDKAMGAAIVTRMELAFGLDVSRVKPRAETAPAGARAFVTGNDVFFAPGCYDPNAAGGRALIGHELAHVQQQAEGR